MAQLNQEVQQLYSSLMDRMRQGTEMHEKLADYYNFLNLPGYQKCHEYHMLCELLTYQKAKDDYMKEYNQLVQPNYGNYTMMAANNSGNNNSGGNSGDSSGDSSSSGSGTSSSASTPRGTKYAHKKTPQPTARAIARHRKPTTKEQIISRNPLAKLFIR